MVRKFRLLHNFKIVSKCMIAKITALTDTNLKTVEVLMPKLYGF